MANFSALNGRFLDIVHSPRPCESHSSLAGASGRKEPVPSRRDDVPHDATTGAAPPRTCTCSPHRTRWLLVRPDLIRDTNEQQFVETALELCPQIARARTLVQDFAALVHTRQEHDGHQELAPTRLGAPPGRRR